MYRIIRILSLKLSPRSPKGRLAMLLSSINDDPIHDLLRDLHPDTRQKEETMVADT